MQPTAVVQAAGVKIGIIGLMTSSALTATISSNVGGLSVAPLAETIRAHATRLRRQGAAVVIVTAHAGGRCSRFDRPEDLVFMRALGEIFTIAARTATGPGRRDRGGHSHAGIAHQVEGIAITEAFSGGARFSEG